MVGIQTLMTFFIYFIALMAIGIYFYRKTADIEDYLLGGREMGSWVTALSAQASDMSGWLLMGLPGAVYLSGLAEAWIAVGLFIGTYLNWKYVAPRLRVYTKDVDAITLPYFFEARFKDPTGALRIISAVIILIFFTIYSSSGLVASGRLFEAMFNIDYNLAVVTGAIVVILYTFLGGFMAVSWTDFVQGILMFAAITIVPIIAYFNVGGLENITQVMQARDISFSMLPGSNLTWLGIISALAWGLGYFGQPHILARFMGIKSEKKLPKAMKIAVIWVLISLAGAVLVGLVSTPMFEGLSGGTEEKVFIYMINELMNPWLGGILLAAILSAIMSTIDSQLLVVSSALTEDLYSKIMGDEISEKQLIWIGRLSVVVIALIALGLALNPDNTVLGLVAYSWAGFGAAFGPVVLFALFCKQTSWKSALLGMIVGTLVLITWNVLGLDASLYEIVPGFIANVVAILLGNKLLFTASQEVKAEFEEVIN